MKSKKAVLPLTISAILLTISISANALTVVASPLVGGLVLLAGPMMAYSLAGGEVGHEKRGSLAAAFTVLLGLLDESPSGFLYPQLTESQGSRIGLSSLETKLYNRNLNKVNSVALYFQSNAIQGTITMNEFSVLWEKSLAEAGVSTEAADVFKKFDTAIYKELEQK